METGLEYPTIHGVPVSYKDLYLPDSRLNPNQPRNYNNHHSVFPRRTYKKIGGLILLETFRNIETHIPHILLDTHELIHQEYDPPKMATWGQMMDEIERAKDAGEKLKEYKRGIYVCRSIGDEVLQQCIANYDYLKQRGQ